jgi:YVTN family beta-propeller protein
VERKATQPRPAPAAGLRAVVNTAGDATLSILDLEAERVVARIPVGTEPHENAVSPDGRFAYVTNQGENSVSVVDLAARREVHRAAIGNLPHGIALHPGGRRLYVTSLPGSVLVVDTEALRVVEEIAVSAIDATTNRIVATIPGLSRYPEALAVQPDGRALWVAGRLGNAINVVDLERHEVVATIPTGAGSQPLRLAFTPDGRRAWVSAVGPKEVQEYDVARRRLQRRRRLPTMPVSIVFRPDGRKAYLLDWEGGGVFVVNRARLRVTKRLRTGKLADGISLVPGP